MESLIQESVYRKKVEVMSHNQDFLQNDFELVFQDEKIQTDVVYQGAIVLERCLAAIYSK